MKKIREQADFDQAENQPEKLHTYDKQEFSDRGRADIKVRPNDPRFADNPMADKPTNDERLLDELAGQSLIGRLHQMLSNADISDQRIRGGIELTRTGKMKVAARLGVGPDDIDMYINSLVQQLRDEDEDTIEQSLAEQYYNAVNVIDEDDEDGGDSGDDDDDEDEALDEDEEAGQSKRPFAEDRYSYEPDALGSVTVRDATTGKSTFVQGARASQLLAQLKAQSGNEEAILAPLVEALDDTATDGSFWGEIKADAGSYNFQWEINGQHGTGTVMFQANGKPKMQLIGIRDMHGNEVEADPTMQRQLQQQALAFIGKE